MELLTAGAANQDAMFRGLAAGYADSTTTNTSSLIPDAELTRFSRGLLTFAAIMTVLIMITGIIGNLLTIVALLRCPRVRNVAAAFIISLCVADFIFCLLTLPFSSSRFIHGGWIHGDVLCTMFPFMRYGNVGVSLLSIAMITINRYIMIAHYNVYSRIYRPCYIAVMICFCWCLSYGMQLPTLFGVWGKFGLHRKLGTCTIINDANGRSSKTALFIIAFVIPCIVIICCYARIFWVVHSSEVRMRKHAVSRPEGNSNNFINPAAKKKEEKALKAKRNEWKITQMVLAIFLSYVACYLPITIVKVADDEVVYPGFHVLGYILLYFSACVNPIIYVIMNKQYRQAYKTVLLCRRPRLLSSTPANLSSYAGTKQLPSAYQYTGPPVSLPTRSFDLPRC
ncbi:UNVERIFIED_CONTAM: hypothetical protein PYX00_002135 [Menopon gallinae]|uniref:G-protein coupled receptors family 1 profile domain-containing protein n=1 Tax=Menopon gallinae TaxID=328185 RepID=A0AAW2IGU4_9NEOP